MHEQCLHCSYYILVLSACKRSVNIKECVLNIGQVAMIEGSRVDCIHEDIDGQRQCIEVWLGAEHISPTRNAQKSAQACIEIANASTISEPKDTIV